jgi:hypothetical protein
MSGETVSPDTYALSLARLLLIDEQARKERLSGFDVRCNLEELLGLSIVAMTLERSTELIYAGVVAEIYSKLDVFKPTGEDFLVDDNGAISDFEAKEKIENVASTVKEIEGDYTDDQIVFGIRVLRRVWEVAKLRLPETEVAQAVLQTSSPIKQAVALVKSKN